MMMVNTNYNKNNSTKGSTNQFIHSQYYFHFHYHYHYRRLINIGIVVLGLLFVVYFKNISILTTIEPLTKTTTTNNERITITTKNGTQLLSSSSQLEKTKIIITPPSPPITIVTTSLQEQTIKDGTDLNDPTTNSTGNHNPTASNSSTNDTKNDERKTKVDPKMNNNNVDDNDAIVETVEVVYNDLKYRRVCTSVGKHSVLCMTIRYPFNVSLQTNDTTIRYPYPVTNDFYHLNQSNIHFITQQEWIQCKINYNTTEKELPDEEMLIVQDDNDIQQCIMQVFDKLFTKQQYEKEQRQLQEQQDAITTNHAFPLNQTNTITIIDEPVIVIWTRQIPNRILVSKNKPNVKDNSMTNTTNDKNNDAITLFHGVGHETAVRRMYQFFGNDHEIIVAGASPAPGITECLHKLFVRRTTTDDDDDDYSNQPSWNTTIPKDTGCYDTQVHRWPNYNCDNPYVDNNNNDNNNTINNSSMTNTNIFNNIKDVRNNKNNNNNNKQAVQRITKQQRIQNRRKLIALRAPWNVTYPFTELEEGHINLGILDYRFEWVKGTKTFPPYNVIDKFLKEVKRKPGWDKNQLRNLSIIVEYPFAHVQTQDMIYHQPDIINLHQTKLPKYLMEFRSMNGFNKLTKQGYKLKNMIVFDGLPQFYPTATSGWSLALKGIRKEFGVEPDNFTYPGWKPEYGTNCIGPLPTNSPLKDITRQGRQSFLRQFKFNPQWYGRTWEFTNLFWFQMEMYYGNSGMDCTHTLMYDGFSGVHRFFVQAMIDDFYENS